MAILLKSTTPTLKINRKRTMFSKGLIFVLIFSCLLGGIVYQNHMSTMYDVTYAPIASQDNLRKPQSNPDEKHIKWYEKSQPKLSDWPVLDRRMDSIPILEKLKMKRGIEVGVQKGIFAKKSLELWPSCEEYKLVDLWGNEKGYVVPFGWSRKTQEGFLADARARMAKLKRGNVPEFFVMRSTEAAEKLKDNYFDYVYLDARHDYCAVLEDITLYYQKLRAGGILSGHDYGDAQYAKDRLPPGKGDWSKCEDGTTHPGAVKGAVDVFAKETGLHVVLSNEDFPSWYVQKPYDN